MSLENLFPAQPVELPSKGKLYPKDNPLSAGVVNVKVMTAKEEDILTNAGLLKKGLAIDKVLQSLVVEKIDYDSLLLCDKNTIFLASRVFAFGKEYEFMYTDEEGRSLKATVDLTTLKDKVVDYSQFNDKNEFNFTLPLSNTPIVFKLLTHRDRKLIDAEIEGMSKISNNLAGNVTSTLKRQIVEINGERSYGKISKLVENIPSRDVKALRKYIDDLTPGLEFVADATLEDGSIIPALNVPITIDFFFPGSGL